MDRIYPLLNFNINVNIFLPNKNTQNKPDTDKKRNRRVDKALVKKTNKL